MKKIIREGIKMSKEFAEVEAMHRGGLKKQIQLYLDSNTLTSKELEKIIHFCNGGDAIH